MVKIQLDLPEELSKQIDHYRIDSGCENKKQAIIKILTEKLITDSTITDVDHTV